MITRSLGDIQDEVAGTIRTGPFGSQLHESDYTQYGIPVVMPKDIVDGRISHASIARVSEETAERLTRHRMLPGDIVYGRRGDIGRRACITERESGWLCGTGCLRVSLGDSLLHPKFLYYFLGQARVSAWILNQAVGATLPNLNTAIMRSVIVSYPDLPTQRKIAAILSTYDDLIENNTRRIATLEEMAYLLYREWFVDFRFPGHESVPIVASPLGPRPEGWPVANFTEIAHVLSGGTPRTTVAEYWGGEILFFAPRDARSSPYITRTDKSITEEGLRACNSQLYPKDTVFITARGTVGTVVMPAYDMAMNQSCYALLGREGVTQPYLYLATKYYVEQLKKQTGGATFETIVVDTFRRLPVIKPLPHLVTEFSTQAEPLLHLIRALQIANDNLRQTRDLLLPRIISGEIDVEDLDINTEGLAA